MKSYENKSKNQISNSKKDSLYLDGLRGLAATAVVLHHYSANFYPATINGNFNLVHNNLERILYLTPLSLFVSGDFAVSIFFVLSGYVLSNKFLYSGKLEDLRSASFRRYFRLMPPVLCSVILAYLLIRLNLIYSYNLSQITFSEQWMGNYWRFDPNLLEAIKEGLFGAFISGSKDYNGVLWTMNVEFIGSLMVFGLLALFGKNKHRYCVYLILCILLFNSPLIAFLIGLMLRDMKELIERKSIGKYSILLSILLILGGLYLGYIRFPINIEEDINLFFAPGNASQMLRIIAASLLIAGLMINKKAQKILSKKPLLFLGYISFSMYLVHILILGSYSSYLFRNLLFSFSYNKSFLIMLSISIPVIILFSFIYTKIIDDSAVKLSTKLYKNIFNK